jgi:NAD(P)H-dependent flavin oxidoreductase YrpB (nitropropane dioxygenase family)
MWHEMSTRIYRLKLNGNIERGSLMAGQSVNLVDKIKPIQGIIDEMVNDAEYELQRLNKIFMDT